MFLLHWLNIHHYFDLTTERLSEIKLGWFVFLRHEGEMYKTLLNDYDSRQKDLVGENAELKKVLQQMKREMVSILSQRKQTFRDEKPNDDHEQVGPVVAYIFPRFLVCRVNRKLSV